ncbi:ParA family protein [Cryobacterium sp. N19]|uniref:ParA family protein n=1 Tax=Cryobacterium sp. N19 TaxID=2048288 RepID=UPI000CE32C86|nr:ParA family protein [Cryobacterium sp. N19]
MSSQNQATTPTTNQHTDPPVSTAFRGASRAQGYIEADATTPERPVAPLPEQLAVDETAAPSTATPQGPLGSPSEPALADLFGGSDHDLGLLSAAPTALGAQRGLRGVLSRLGFSMTPGSAELAEREQAEALRRDEETIRQATWTRAVSVLVANQKGGVGKTPSAIIVGGVLAAARGGSVCILEVSDDPGALSFRAEGNPARGMGELVRDVDTISSAGQLAGYTAPQTSFASVIGTVRRRPRLTHEDVTAVAAVVDQFYGIRVMDSGNQPSSSAFQGAVDTADALVIPVFNAGDAVLEAVALLDVLRSAGGKAASLADHATILRLTDGRPENRQVVDRVDQIIADAGVEQVFTIPYDPHIAERGQITLGHLAPQTRRAFTAAAAGVVRTLQATVQ